MFYQVNSNYLPYTVDLNGEKNGVGGEIWETKP